jgi:hypothetical protein
MEATSDRPVLLSSSRRTFRLLHPGTQLRLALQVLLLGLGFGLLLAWNTYYAYADLVAMVLATAPASFARQLEEQSVSFALVAAALLLAYVLATVALCVAYSRRLLGPTVALRRQIQSLKSGSCSGRVELRRADVAFTQLADDLNELTRVLAQRRRGDDPRSS